MAFPFMHVVLKHEPFGEEYSLPPSRADVHVQARLRIEARSPGGLVGERAPVVPTIWMPVTTEHSAAYGAIVPYKYGRSASLAAGVLLPRDRALGVTPVRR
jgi:hypothetical protein